MINKILLILLQAKENNMEKGLVLKKEYFIQHIKEDVRLHYDIQPKQIGKGAYGRIFLAHPKSNKNLVRAVKFVKKQYNNCQYLAQAAILRQLDHPNILKMYEIYEDSQGIYLITDYFEGGDLIKVLETSNISEEQARDIFKQVLEAINYCHNLNIVHRDVKLENLMFLNKKSFSLKLIDFGLALKWAGSLSQYLKKQKSYRTVGSILYLAPECFTGFYSQKCDIWSLGVVLYTMITATFPFQGANDKQTQKKIQNYKFTTPIQKIEASKNLKDLLSKIFVAEEKRLSAKQLFDHLWLIQGPGKTPLKLNFSKLVSFSKFSKIKTLAVSFIASQLSQKQIEKLSALFRQIDTNHDGFLSIQELTSAFQQQKQKSSLIQLSKVISFIDTDKNGKINYTEFISSCLQNSLAFKQENLKAAFRLLDKDQNGTIQKEELALALKQSGFAIDIQNVQEILKSCDKNGDGRIDYKQFVDCISKR